MGATRATVSYTYESANQWLSHSKDMWWWLQKRVITEHECQHPTPPTSDTIRSVLTGLLSLNLLSSRVLIIAFMDFVAYLFKKLLLAIARKLLNIFS